MAGKGEFEILEPKKGQTEFIRINGTLITLGLSIFNGKTGDCFGVYAPSIEVSGYGDTREEAMESFKLSLDLFCEDVLQLKRGHQEIELARLGWLQEKFKKKNFSKAYIDSDGALQNFDAGTVESEFMEMAV